MAIRGGNVYVGVLWPDRVLNSTNAITWEPIHQFDQHVLSLSFGQLG